jgi:hypothetical protein
MPLGSPVFLSKPAKRGFPKLMPTRKMPVGAKELSVEWSKEFIGKQKKVIKKPRRTAACFSLEEIIS